MPVDASPTVVKFPALAVLLMVRVLPVIPVAELMLSELPDTAPVTETDSPSKALADLHAVQVQRARRLLHQPGDGAALLPRRADGGHVLPRVGQQVDLGARVVVPKGHKRAHEFREGARHGDMC